MQAIRISFIFFFVSFFFISVAQEKLIAIRDQTSKGFSFYDYDGKVRFTLPPGHNPAVRSNADPDDLGNFYVYDFSYKALPIRHDKGFYLVNEFGKTIRDFAPGYTYVSLLQNGYFRAHRILSDSIKLVGYYDQNGLRAFGETEFIEGGGVINDVALVKLYQPGIAAKLQDGDWVLVDKNGGVLKNISQNIEGKIVGFEKEEYPHQWFLSRSGAKFKSSICILPNGETHHLSFENKSPERQKMNRYFDVADSIADVHHLSMKTRWIYPTNIINGEVVFLSQKADGSGVLYDQWQKEIKLEQNGTTVIPRYFIDEYVIATVYNDDKYISTSVFDLRNRQVVASFDRDPSGRDGDIFVFYSHSDWSTVEKVVTIKGKTIYQLDFSKRFVTDINEIKTNRDQIKMIWLRGKSLPELETIGVLKNVEVVEIEKYHDEHLPDDFFNGWNNVSTLKITRCKNLKVLPASMKGLKKLTNLTLLSDEPLSEFISWLDSWPLLKKVKTDLPIPDELYKKYPGLFEIMPVIMKSE